MPETADTAREIINIKRDIREIKQSQEAGMHFNRDKYEKLVSDTLAGNPIRVKVYLEVDGVKSRKEIQDIVGGKQPTVWRAIDHLEKHGLIFDLEQTKGSSPIYAKPQWAKTLRMDDYVREHFPTQLPEVSENQSKSRDSNNQQSA
jgi:Fic family protein